ncbi:TPA: DUF4435 domain-containing protein [Photobacterium damselae]
MDDFCYSNEAEDILNQFYSVDAMLYVEGQDDIPFWEFMFNKFCGYSVEIQDVGSCTALIPYIERIHSGELEAIVATDLDLGAFSSTLLEHKNIVRTPKYAIENTMIFVDCLSKALKVLARKSARQINNYEIEAWLEYFYTEIKPLIIMDIVNARKASGISVIGDNATRFMISRNSSQLCPAKLQNYSNSISQQLGEYDEQEILDLIESKGYKPSDLVRGHFLFSAVSRFLGEYIKALGINISLSNDALYSSLVLALETVFNEEHSDFSYFKSKIENVEIAA